MELELRHRTAHETCASLGPVVIRICDGVRTEVADLVRQEQLFDELLETHANIAMLVVFTHDTPPPDGAAQRHAKQFMRRYRENVVVAVALLGLGFWASAVRVALSTIVRVVGHGSISIEGTVEQAITRVTMELVGIDAGEIQRAYELLWAELSVPSARARTGTDP
ncbi:hypothetical protein DB30_02124 [Enhygromyxa salina]|uniref:Uncharacterized protein n=1 Tax=Enhygromyxa salina TaxID=215803 RepID=A0A0C2CL88_9BACT|nr:hypothetical protein [Enhygromyxa salina]KIG12006.1 hypothetical protein DB30_02124 [Enhygromyxa salina]